MKNREVRLILLVSSLSLLLLTAWGGLRKSMAGQPGPINATTIPFIPANDLQFIDAIIPHHQAAIQMAQIERQKGARDDVKALAEGIVASQMLEIGILQNARQELAGSPTVPAPPDDPHIDSDIAQLQQASGLQVDELFLEHMIAHHANAISLSHRALPNLQRADVKQVALNAYNSQAHEVGDMAEMRGKMPSPSP